MILHIDRNVTKTIMYTYFIFDTEQAFVNINNIHKLHSNSIVLV